MEELGQFSRDRLGKTHSRRLSLIFLLVVSVTMFAFSLYGAQASVFEKARETVLDIIEPVVTLFNAPIRFVDNRIGNITDYFDALEQNKRLREENEELRAWMNQAITLQRQVNYYEELLGAEQDQPAQGIDAMVVGEGAGPYRRALILNAGKQSGVKRGDAVVGVNGLIGHIVSAGNSASRVLMLTDYSSRVPVFIEGAEIEAILAGKVYNDPELMFLNTRDVEDLSRGMRVVTSGEGGNLPRGVPVGEISDMEGGVIKVRLYSHYLDTDYVRVLSYAFTEEETFETEPEGQSE